MNDVPLGVMLAMALLAMFGAIIVLSFPHMGTVARVLLGIAYFALFWLPYVVWWRKEHEKPASKDKEGQGKDRKNQGKDQNRRVITLVEMPGVQIAELEKERQKQESQQKKEALLAFHDGPFTQFLELREQVIKEARPAGNWQLQYQSLSATDQVEYSCQYHGKKDVNIFKTLAHLQAFLRDKLSDDGKIRRDTNFLLIFGWTLHSVYHALRYYVYVSLGEALSADGKAAGSPVIRLVASGVNQNNLVALEEFISLFEVFFIKGYPEAVTDYITPTDFEVETFFSMHDGGNANLEIRYDSGLMENHNLCWGVWYSPPDMRSESGLIMQDELAHYLQNIKNLEVYY